MLVLKKTPINSTWDAVQNSIGDPYRELHVGDEIHDVLNNGEPAAFIVVATNHYQRGEYVFRFSECVGPLHYMNPTCNEDVFWEGSAMREYINNEFVELLPVSLQSVISPHALYHPAETEGEAEESCSDMLWLPSEVEVTGSTEYGIAGPDEHQFPYYKEKKNQILHNRDGDEMWGWLSTTAQNHHGCFCYSYGFGLSAIRGAAQPGGVAPCFLIRQK